METLLDHIERMTSGRDRPKMELALAQSLAYLLKAKRVCVFKCGWMAGKSVVWPAVEIDGADAMVHDDGLGMAENFTPVTDLPHIKAFLDEGHVTGPVAGITLFPIRQDGSRWFGYVEVSHARIDAPVQEEAEKLIAIFTNMMSLLDYSEVDNLTGLLNRKTYDNYLYRMLTRKDRSDASVQRQPQRRQPPVDPTTHWLGVIDVDHFKRINDQFGHSIGDEVLLTLANLLKGTFRVNDKLFRFGGEEFVVLLSPSTETNAHAAFERFRWVFESHTFPMVGKITVSIGYTRISPMDRSLVFGRADDALYWAKQHGRNRVCRYEALVASGELQPKADVVGDVEIFE